MTLSSSLGRLALSSGRLMVGGRFSRAIADLKHAESLSPDELRARQEARLQDLCSHAATTVPYWRDVFRERGLAPDSIRSLEDLQQLPLLDKEVVRSRPLEDFLSETAEPHRREPYTTSGSTGDPFRFVLDRAMAPIVYASHLYFDSWFGIDPLDRYLRVAAPPAPPQPLREGTPLGARLRYRLRGRLQSTYESLTQQRFSTFEADPERFRQAFDRFQPDYVMGYTGTLALIARTLLDQGWRAKKPMKAIITIAENLTDDRREVLEECFRGPIANRYGQREFKFWAAQSDPANDTRAADPGRFRVVTELVVPETLDDDGAPCGDDSVGRLVMTSLHNRVMPFLRYDTKDMASLVPSDGAGGRNLPSIERLDGRRQEILRLPCGKTIDPTTLGHFLFVVKGFVDRIRFYQLVENDEENVTLKVVPTASFDETTEPALATALGDLLGPDLRIQIERTDEIQLEKSGKRPIIKLRRPGTTSAS
ncbi:MAG: hypothetical protein AAF196_04895 [Planctomycetota bacterium]